MTVKTSFGFFADPINDGRQFVCKYVRMHTTCKNPNIEYGIRDMLKWLKDGLDQGREYFDEDSEHTFRGLTTQDIIDVMSLLKVERIHDTWADITLEATGVNSDVVVAIVQKLFLFNANDHECVSLSFMTREGVVGGIMVFPTQHRIVSLTQMTNAVIPDRSPYGFL